MVILKSKKAFGLTEVLVATGLVSIVGLGLSQVMVNATKQQKGVQAKDNQREVTAVIRNLLSNENACQNTFSAIDVTAVRTVSDIKDALNANKFSVNTNDASGFLKYTKFETSVFLADAGPNPNIGTMDFRVYLEKIGDTMGVREIKPDVIKLKVEKAGNILVRCIAIGAATDGLWQKSGVNLSWIYYNAGNVGIGTVAPAYPLDVNGVGRFVSPNSGTTGGVVIRDAAGNSGVSILQFVDNGGTVQYGYVQGLSGTGMALMGGNVGIGTASPIAALHVNGAVKIGASTSTCTTALEGQIRYNSAARMMELCNGTAWLAMNGRHQANQLWS